MSAAAYGIIGVVVGALLSTIGTFVLERMRFGREEARSRYQDRFRVYSGILNETHPFKLAVMRDNRDEASMSSSMERLFKLRAEAQILASPKVHNEAEELSYVTMKLYREIAKARVGFSEPGPTFDEILNNELVEKRRAFIKVARSEIGVPTLDKDRNTYTLGPLATPSQEETGQEPGGPDDNSPGEQRN